MAANKISRKTFFRIAGTSLLLAGIYLWDLLVKRQEEMNGRGVSRHADASIYSGVTFFNYFYLFRSGNKVTAFSNACTHAGCMISSETKGILSCPCHGSRFEASTGNPLKGPAFRPLKSIDCRLDEKTKEWVIRF